jgi:hypothetical protein
MNALRRILLAVYSAVLLAAAGGLIALTWNQDKKLDLEVADFNLQAFVNASDGAKWAVTGVLAGIALFGFLTLLAAILRPSKASSRGTLRMKQADGGTVVVPASAIETLLRDELERLPEIRRVTPTVRVSSGAVDTVLDATIEPSASIAHATRVLGDGVAAVLKDQVGVTSVRRPIIHISYDELAARPAGTVPGPRFEQDARPLYPATVTGPAHPEQPTGEESAPHA